MLKVEKRRHSPEHRARGSLRPKLLVRAGLVRVRITTGLIIRKTRASGSEGGCAYG